MNWDLAVFVVFVIAAFIGVIVHNWNVARDGTPIDRWAKANGYTLLSEEREMFASMRLFGMPAKTLQKYLIVVRDPEGRTCRGRLEWSGSALDKMHVRWDD